MHPTSDASLLFAAARSRDGDAIAELAHRYTALMYSVSSRVTGSSAQAERLTLEAVGDLAARPAQVRGEPAVWIHGQTARRAYAAINHASPPQRNDPAEEPHWEELARSLDAAMLRLGGRHRNVIIQHYFQRHGQDDLAEMLQVTQPVVAQRLRKALDLLRLRLVDLGAGCSLGHLMMLLARNAASEAPPDLVARAGEAAAQHLAAAPARRGGWLGVLTVWGVIAGLLVAVAASYSTTRGSAAAATTQPTSR